MWQFFLHLCLINSFIMANFDVSLFLRCKKIIKFINIDMQQQDVSTKKAQKEQQKIESTQQQNTQKQLQAQQIPTQNPNYSFSSKYKHKDVQLRKDNLTVDIGAGKHGLALVDGAVLENDSSIRFCIQSIGHHNVAIGLAIRNVVAISGSTYAYGLWGDGYFLVFNDGETHSHSHKDQDKIKTDFSYTFKDVIKISTKGEELVFLNENSLKRLKMKIKLTLEEWRQARFCAHLNYYSTVTILK